MSQQPRHNKHPLCRLHADTQLAFDVAAHETGGIEVAKC